MDHELLILGAGPGGYEAAIRAAQLGLNVGLIERDAVGGTCLNRGCIPTKTLLHDAGPGADFLALNAHKEQVVSTLRQGVEGLLKKRRVTVYRGTGVLTDDHTIEVDGQAVTGEKLLLAPGSRPALPPVEGIDLALTSDDLLHEPRPLESLLILGGGVIGVEMAAFYAATGTKVTIVEAQERLLPQMDREISQNLQMIFKRQGMGVHTRALARRISEGGEGVVMELDGGETLTASAVLAAVEEEPPQPASRDAAIPAASRDASAFFMCLTSCDQICCVLVCSCVFLCVLVCSCVFLVVVFLRKKMLSGFRFFVSSVLTVCLYYTVFTFPLPAKKMRKNKIIRSKFERIIFLLKNIRSNFVHNLQI